MFLICKFCNSPLQGYFGQTCNSFHIRLNGHRSCFKIEPSLASQAAPYEKSAFSIHVNAEHFLDFSNKLSNFDFGIIKQVRPIALDRAEDFFVWKTKSDIGGLNRHKVVK